MGVDCHLIIPAETSNPNQTPIKPKSKRNYPPSARVSNPDQSAVKRKSNANQMQVKWQPGCRLTCARVAAATAWNGIPALVQWGCRW